MSFYATNRRNIDTLRDERDRAGLAQLITILGDTAGPHAHDAARLIEDAENAIGWIDATSPRVVPISDPTSIRLGDILEYEVDGTPRQGVVFAIVNGIAVTTQGDEVPLQ